MSGGLHATEWLRAPPAEQAPVLDDVDVAVVRGFYQGLDNTEIGRPLGLDGRSVWARIRRMRRAGLGLERDRADRSVREGARGAAR